MVLVGNSWVLFHPVGNCPQWEVVLQLCSPPPPPTTKTHTMHSRKMNTQVPCIYAYYGYSEYSSFNIYNFEDEIKGLHFYEGSLIQMHGRSYGGGGGLGGTCPHKFSVPPLQKKIMHTYFFICQFRACVNTLLPTKIMLMHSLNML